MLFIYKWILISKSVQHLFQGHSLSLWEESSICIHGKTEATPSFRRGADNTEQTSRMKASSRVQKNAGLSSVLTGRSARTNNLPAQFDAAWGKGSSPGPDTFKEPQTSAYMLKHLENGLMMFTTEMNCTITVSLIYIKNYSRQMHLHKIYLSILIYCNLHNLAMPTAICRQPLGK